MLALLLAWLLLAACALPPGWWLLARFDTTRAQMRAGDRHLAALWLGLSAGCALLATLSLLTALSAPASLALLLTVQALLWRQTRIRQQARTLLAAVQSNGTLTGMVMLSAVAVAAHATQTVTSYDPGLYHYQHLQWLSDYGVVRGMGLIHSRFGFAGTWFALPSMLNHGPLRARVSTLGGGLVLWLALAQWLLCVQRCRQASARDADRYLLVALGLMLIYVIDKGWFNATSPDAPVFVLTILIGWLMLLTPRGASALPLLLALAAVGFKLSALPLLPVAAWHAGWPHSRRAVWVAAPLALLLAAQSFVSSGCLAYPLASSCLAVDWGVGAAAAARDTAQILQWARWGALPPAVPAASGRLLAWLPTWASAHDVEIALFALALAAVVGRCRRLSRLTSAGSVAGLALLSIAFGMISAPDARFWGGSLFALLGLAGLPYWPARAGTVPVAGAMRGVWVTLLMLVALIAMTIAGWAQRSRADWWRPPAMRLPALTLRSNAAGLAYWQPTSGDQCWSAPLPCAPQPLADGIRYRTSEAGAGAGFTRGD